MTKLSSVESEARRRLGRFPKQKLEALQREIIELCEGHWSLIRGPEPVSGLARALWTVRPHLIDLFIDLYGTYDAELSEIISNLPAIKVIAALVLAEIEHGDAEGARLAYEAMMLFETEKAAEIYTDSVRSRLRGIAPDRAKRHKHEHHDALFRSLATICEQTGRSDLQAIVVALQYLTAVQANPVAREHTDADEKILGILRDLDLMFLGFEAEKLHYTVRGASKRPVSAKRLEDMLAQIRGHS